MSSSPFWKERRVFVTGCTGILGSWLTLSLLDAGAYVVGLIRDRVPLSHLRQSGAEQRIAAVDGDIANGALLERVLNEYEIEVVFHPPLRSQPSWVRTSTWAVAEGGAAQPGPHPRPRSSERTSGSGARWLAMVAVSSIAGVRGEVSEERADALVRAVAGLGSVEFGGGLGESFDHDPGHIWLRQTVSGVAAEVGPGL